MKGGHCRQRQQLVKAHGGKPMNTRPDGRLEATPLSVASKPDSFFALQFNLLKIKLMLTHLSKREVVYPHCTTPYSLQPGVWHSALNGEGT